MIRRLLALLTVAALLPACGGDGGSPNEPPPPPPTGVTVSSPTAQTLTLNWIDSGPDEQGYHIHVRLAGASSFALWSSVAANATSAVVGGLTSTTSYDVQVTAFNDRGDSSPSNMDTGMTGTYAWTQLTNATPSLQFAQAVYVPPPLDRMIVFGGTDDTPAQTDDLHLVNPATGAMSPLVPTTLARPGPRFLPSLVYDSQRNSLILFGGNLLPADIAMNDVWEFSLAAGDWSLLTPGGTPPSARNGHSAVYDSVHGSMVVFGGVDDVTFDILNDVHRLILPAAGPPVWQSLAVSGTLPIPRDRHTAVFDALNSRMIVFGGTDNGNVGNPFTNELSALSLSAGPDVVWTRLASQLDVPAPRAGHAAVYDSISHKMVVFGGQLETGTDVDYRVWTLSLDGSNTWNEVTLPPGSGARMYAGAVFDSTRVRMLLVGGNSGLALNDPEIWAFGF